MTAAKIAISLPREVLKRARQQVKAGKAKSLSALVSQAIEEKVQRDELTDILDQMDAERGPPGKAAEAWARRVLK
jgi:Arc/MetJ-type ribon-helix-helix transcriptional regulator